ncbi:hypothetical protein [Deinococcus altitudinis]|uniref:hypothetical protein n=1 Tax=Deinococcus altitudinis TaxID=468914 RepID=UPI003891F98C
MVILLKRMLACLLFVAGGSSAFMGLHLEWAQVTWAHTLVVLGGLISLGSGMALSRPQGQV